MTFADIVAWCAGRLDAGADAIATATGQRPHVSDTVWWQPGLPDPAAFLWMRSVQSTETVDSCWTRDDVPMVLSFSVQPGAHEGTDMVTVAAVLDAVLPVVDHALPELARQTRRIPVRQGFAVVRDQTGGPDAPKPLVIEVPVLIPWSHHVTS